MTEYQLLMQATVAQLLRPGKGIVALDESTATAAKRLEGVGLENTEDNRRMFREIFINADGMEQYVSGVILYDETIRQSDRQGIPFRETLEKKGVVIGIKVDEGVEPVLESEAETVTKGLASLAARLPEYVALGARFAKWRAAIPVTDDLPTEAVVKENASRMAQYAQLCQAVGIVPIVEPEVLMEGGHSQARAKEVVRMVLSELMMTLQDYNVWLPGVILKTSMVVPGTTSGEPIVPTSVAADTSEVLLATVPESIGGVVFLSGGQSTKDALRDLDAIADLEPLPFEIACSFARALQMPAIAAWEGNPENIEKAQSVFVATVAQMSQADKGLYA